MAPISRTLRHAADAAKRHWPLLPVVALALYLRTANLLPLFYYGDEAEYAIVASYLAQDWTYLAYPAIENLGVRPFVSQPPLVLYLMGLSMRIFGATDIAAVGVNVILGTAAVVVLYFIGNEVHGRVMGTFAAAFLAVLPMHVEFSRSAFLDAGLVFFWSLTVLLTLVWVRTRSPKAALGAGAAAGATVLSKLPGVLLLGVLLVYLAYEAAVHLAGWMRRRDPEQLAALNATGKHTLLAMVPMALMGLAYLALIMHLGALFDLYAKALWQLGRVDTSVGTAQEVTHVFRPWHWYFTHFRYSLPAQFGPLLWWLTLFGAAFTVFEFARRPVKHRTYLLLILWPALTLAFFVWSERKEYFYMLPTATGLMLVAALPPARFAHALVEWTRRHNVPWRRAAGGVAVLGVLLLASAPALANTYESWDDYVYEERKFGYGVKEAAHYIHENDPEAKQIGTLLGRWPLHFYNGQPTYHWYVPHDKIEQEIESGEVRWLVLDTYLDLPHEEQYYRDLTERYNGEVVKTWTRDADWGEVQLIRLNP